VLWVILCLEVVVLLLLIFLWSIYPLIS
jgi:hypothetical protein